MFFYLGLSGANVGHEGNEGNEGEKTKRHRKESLTYSIISR
jgi:hypothetical protein